MKKFKSGLPTEEKERDTIFYNLENKYGSQNNLSILIIVETV